PGPPFPCRVPARFGRPPRVPPEHPVHQNGAMTDSGDFDAAWLPDAAFRAVGARRSVIRGGTDPLTDTVRRELTDACAWFGGEVVRDGDTAEFVLEVTGGSPDD